MILDWMLAWAALGLIGNAIVGYRVARGDYDGMWWVTLAATSVAALLVGPFTFLFLLFVGRRT